MTNAGYKNSDSLFLLLLPEFEQTMWFFSQSHREHRSVTDHRDANLGHRVLRCHWVSSQPKPRFQDLGPLLWFPRRTKDQGFTTLVLCSVFSQEPFWAALCLAPAPSQCPAARAGRCTAAAARPAPTSCAPAPRSPLAPAGTTRRSASG